MTKLEKIEKIKQWYKDWIELDHESCKANLHLASYKEHCQPLQIRMNKEQIIEFIYEHCDLKSIALEPNEIKETQ